jgi:hypothetical protein
VRRLIAVECFIAESSHNPPRTWPVLA